MSNRIELIEVDRIGEGARKPGKGKVTYRRVKRDGRTVRVRMIDADGADFTEQLSEAFRSNVRKARAENREIATVT